MNRHSLNLITSVVESKFWKQSRIALAIGLCGSLAALAELPPGATPAPACAGTTASAFPKRLSACGPTFGAWDTAYGYPFSGRAGFYINANVTGTGSSTQSAYIELDQAGNTIRKIAPVQTDTTMSPTEDPNIFFASQHAPNSTDLSFGRYSAAGTYAPIYQYKLTNVTATTSVTPFSADGHVLATVPSGNQVDLISINTNGSTNFGRRLTSSSFALSGFPGESLSFASFPSPDGAMYVQATKISFSLTPPVGINTEIYLMRLSSTGTVEWAKKYTGLAGAGTVFPTASGSLYLSIIEVSLQGTTSFSITKLSSTGTTVWSKKFSGATVFPSGELPGGKLLLSGFLSNGTTPYGATVLAVLGTNGAIETSTQFAIGTFNITTPVIEGSRIWLNTLVPSSGLNPYVSASPAYVGYTDASLGAIQWRKYVRNANYSLVSPDPDTDDVLCSFTNLTDRSVEVFTMKDDLGVSAGCTLLQSAGSITQTAASITVTDGAVTAADFTVTPSPITPTFGTANLTFETQGLAESNLCTGGGTSLPAPSITGSPSNFTTTAGSTVTLTASTTAPSPTWQWKFNGTAIAGQTNAVLTLSNILQNQGGQYTVTLTSGGQTSESSVTVTVNAATGLSFTTHPVSQTVVPGPSVTFTAVVSNPGNATLTYQWLFNGAPSGLNGSTSASLTVPSATAGSVGTYALSVTGNGTTIVSNPAFLALNTTARTNGSANLIASDIVHPNGNVYDQFLMTGSAASFTSAGSKVARISYIDLNDDIVQVEFSGPGVLTINLASASGPNPPTKYNQPTVSYIRGLATITITGATENTHFGCLSVGRFTAFDPTGAFNFLQPVSASNNPANNGSSLFAGQAATVYDGVADIAALNISSPTNRFGGIRISNTRFAATSGTVGIYAPGVRSAGPVNLNNVAASGTATPYLLTGTIDAFGANPAGRIGITGGDMLQPNGKAIQLGDATIIGMLAGATSHNVAQPAQTNKGVYERNGVNVTTSVVQGP